MKALSENQKETLEFIEKFVADNGISPTLQNIADHFGITVPSASNRINALIIKDQVKRDSGKHRSITLTDSSFRFQI